jgi:dihydroxyacetone kinase-like protein
MLDVLVPVNEQLKAAIEQNIGGAELLKQLVETAETSLQATKPMQATKGRASFLGERSIGHLDPGAMSSCLLIKTVCACFGGQT